MIKIKTDRFKVFSRLQLKGKFFIYFAGLVFIVVTFFSIAVFYFHRQILLSMAQEKAFSLTRTLAYTSLNAILLDNYIVVQSLIDGMMDGRDIIAIAILDTHGTIIAASTPEMRGKKRSDPLTSRALAATTYLLQKVPDERGQEIWDTAVPIYNFNKRVGTARIRYSMEDPFRGLLISILIIGVLAILGSLFLAYKFSSSITQPIRQTVNLAAEYGKGNLDTSLNMDRQDEIGDLVKSLNKLSQDLKALIEEKVANENLIMMGEFASYIIHDLKNPLSGIHLLADGMDRKISQDDKLKRYSAEILLATQKLHAFVERTLDIARWNRLNLQPITLRALIEEAVKAVNHQSIAIQKVFDKNMPVINGDYQLLVMAVKNLLNNALEAIDGEGQITIKTEWKNGVFIKISDNGNGIPEEQLASIFRPFYSMKEKGHGLGLAMVKKAIILHHGKIEVQSEIGKGTTFTISLPGNL